MTHDPRRTSPRIDLEALCWEVLDDHETSAFVVDLSTGGARLERPFLGGRIPRLVPLQLELPGVDEVLWASGEVVFDQLVPTTAPIGGLWGFMRRTGYRLAAAAARDLRLLRDYVYEMHRARREEQPLMFASCYARA